VREMNREKFMNPSGGARYLLPSVFEEIKI
jgi:hypothetical protein